MKRITAVKWALFGFWILCLIGLWIVDESDTDAMVVLIILSQVYFVGHSLAWAMDKKEES